MELVFSTAQFVDGKSVHVELSDLQILLQEIREGRSEGEAIEWKRQWWAFDVAESYDEFVRDIAALANAETRDPKVVVVGIDANGRLHNAPLPEDEANLQQRLQRITPIPNVSFRVLRIEEKDVTIVEISEPFEKPYVAKVKNQNIIPLRQGSSTNTATRRHLDRWYATRKPSPELVLYGDGQKLVDGTMLQYTRPMHIAEEPQHTGFLAGLWRTTDPKKEADHRNRHVLCAILLDNHGGAPGADLVIDLTFRPVDEIYLWEETGLIFTGTRWQTDPSQTVFVDGFGVDETNVGHVRQRVQLINPATDEPLVPVHMVAAAACCGTLRGTYRITDAQGVRAEGAFGLQTVFEGKEIVQPHHVL